MKKYFTLLLLSICLNGFCANYAVLSKQFCNPFFNELAKQNRKILEVQNLDQESDGNILIIFE